MLVTEAFPFPKVRMPFRARNGRVCACLTGHCGVRDRIINSHFAGILNSFNMGGRGDGRFNIPADILHFHSGAPHVASPGRAQPT